MDVLSYANKNDGYGKGRDDEEWPYPAYLCQPSHRFGGKWGRH